MGREAHGHREHDAEVMVPLQYLLIGISYQYAYWTTLIAFSQTRD